MGYVAFDIDKELWKRFKKKCLMEDKHIKVEITKFIKGYLGEK